MPRLSARTQSLCDRYSSISRRGCRRRLHGRAPFQPNQSIGGGPARSQQAGGHGNPGARDQTHLQLWAAGDTAARDQAWAGTLGDSAWDAGLLQAGYGVGHDDRRRLSRRSIRQQGFADARRIAHADGSVLLHRGECVDVLAHVLCHASGRHRSLPLPSAGHRKAWFPGPRM